MKTKPIIYGVVSNGMGERVSKSYLFTMIQKILIVEDQFIEGNNLRLILQKTGYSVFRIARSVPDALAALEKEVPDMVLLDIFLEGPLTGIDLGRVLETRNIPFAYLSANSNRQTLEAVKQTKPYGFLIKPFRERDVLVMLEVALYTHGQRQQLLSENHKISAARLGLTYRSDQRIVAVSKEFTDVMSSVKIVAGSDTSVLILGESGTGKELVAQAIQLNSPRKGKPFIIVNCAALPAGLIESELFGHEKGSFTGALEKRIGKFEQADGGTVFLDEIGELPPDLQVKFLRVLQERAVEPIGGTKKRINIRVIAATNKNLEQEISNGRFRMDLYYRLNVFPILIPPLRDRKDDILPLANYFLSVFSARQNKQIAGLSDPAARSMLNYAWPGNIRELENLMERSVLLATSGLITDVLTQPVSHNRNPPTAGTLKSIAENERDHILAALEQSGWKIYGPGGAGELLNINSATLHSKMKKLGIKKETSAKK